MPDNPFIISINKSIGRWAETLGCDNFVERGTKIIMAWRGNEKMLTFIITFSTF